MSPDTSDSATERDTNNLASELPGDVHHVEPTGYHTALFETTGLRSRIDPDDLDNEFGITVHRDGSQLALAAGTVSDDGDQLFVYQALNPDQMRDLASAMTAAADLAERASERPTDLNENPDSWLRRLLR